MMLKFAQLQGRLHYPTCIKFIFAVIALSVVGSAAATNLYVRVDGGDAGQCNGRADAPYPGSGSAQACAWSHPFFALPPGGPARMVGGDVLMIGSGSYMMGLGAAGATACHQSYSWDCFMTAVPSGQSRHRRHWRQLGLRRLPDPPQHLRWSRSAVHARLLRRGHELKRLVAERTRDLESKALELAQADRDKSLLVERLRDQAEAFERQAREDWLTGLPNRRAFEELLEQQHAAARDSSGQLCVAMADIDHFKAINDRHSHATGDQVLIAVAHELRQGAGPGVRIARWGGEEFLLLFSGCGLSQALARWEHIRNAIATRTPFLTDGAPQRVTLSFGVAEQTPEHQRPQQLLSLADKRLYAAKNAGRNCVRWRLWIADAWVSELES